MKHQRGFALLMELLMVMTIMAILAMAAIPSFVHHNNLTAMRLSIETFRSGWLNNVPGHIAPVDPSWQQETNLTTGATSYAKAWTKPAGTLSITPPVSVGGPWSCSFIGGAPAYTFPNC